MDPLHVLDSALDQVSKLQEHVSQAVIPGAALSAVQHLQQAEQDIQQLQNLSAQLQQLAAAVQRAIPPASQQGQTEGAAWAEALQEQARQAAAALQHQVKAAVSAPSRRLLCAAPPKLGQHVYMRSGHPVGALLGQMVQRVVAAAPQLQLHLFRSTDDKLLLSYPDQHRRSLDVAQVSRLAAYIDEVRVVCQGVFVAAIALSAPGRLQPVRVCVDSADRISTVDPWTNSRHQVFKRVSQLAARALLHFQHLEAAHATLAAPLPTSTAEASNSSSSVVNSAEGVSLECLLLWLGCYDDLFSRPCDVSGSVITWTPATAVPLPPLVRPFWLSLEGLREAAHNKAARKAYHTHLVPWPGSEQDTAAPAAAVAEGGAGHQAASSAAAPGGVVMPGAPGPSDLVPWDTVEFTDDELRAQLAKVMGGAAFGDV